MDSEVKDPLIVMSFPVTEEKNIVTTLIERKEEVLHTFQNNEYLKFDETHQELIGLKSTAKVGKVTITDLPALNHVIAHNDRYKDSHILNLGNVNVIYAYFS